MTERRSAPITLRRIPTRSFRNNGSGLYERYPGIKDYARVTTQGGLDGKIVGKATIVLESGVLPDADKMHCVETCVLSAALCNRCTYHRTIYEPGKKCKGLSVSSQSTHDSDTGECVYEIYARTQFEAGNDHMTLIPNDARCRRPKDVPKELLE